MPETDLIAENAESAETGPEGAHDGADTKSLI